MERKKFTPPINKITESALKTILEVIDEHFSIYFNEEDLGKLKSLLVDFAHHLCLTHLFIDKVIDDDIILDCHLSRLHNL